MGVFILCLATVSLVAQPSANKQLPKVELKFGKGLQMLAADSSMALKIGFRFQSLYNSERALEDGAAWESKFLVRWAHKLRYRLQTELAF